jgi:hypothetical protein
MVWNGFAPYGSAQRRGGLGNGVMIAFTATTPTARQPPRLPLRGNPHDFYSAARGEINRHFACSSITHESRVVTRPQVKPNSCYEYQDAKFQKNSAGKEMLAPPRVHYLSRGGPGGHCRYPEDQVPPRTSSRLRWKARHANHTPLRVVNLSINRMAQASSGTATCPADPAPATRPGAAPGPPRVLRTQLSLTGPGQLRGRHVSCGLSSRCPAGVAPGPPRVLRTQLPLPSPGQLRGCHVSCGLSSRSPARASSGATTCALEAQRSACY